MRASIINAEQFENNQRVDEEYLYMYYLQYSSTVVLPVRPREGHREPGSCTVQCTVPPGVTPVPVPVPAPGPGPVPVPVSLVSSHCCLT